MAVDLLDGSGSVELALAYSNRTQLRMLSSDLVGTRDWGRRTLDLVERLPEGVRRDEVRVHALNNLGTMEATAGDLAAGTEMLVESLGRCARRRPARARGPCLLQPRLDGHGPAPPRGGAALHWTRASSTASTATSTLDALPAGLSGPAAARPR